MAMNKKEQAELAAAKREARLRELIVLQPRIPPDIPAPTGSDKPTRGFKAAASSRWLDVVYCESTVAAHYQLDSRARRVGCGRQMAVSLYSTRELAFEAAKRDMVWCAAEEIINKVEQYEHDH